MEIRKRKYLRCWDTSPFCAIISKGKIWLRTDGSLDWNVRRLDGESSCIYIPVPQQKMDGTSGDLRGGKDKMTEWEKER